MAKSPAYRLQVLFEMREKAKIAAEEEYADKKKLVVVEEKKLGDMRQQLTDMIQARNDKKTEYASRTRNGEYTIHQITANDRHISRLKQNEAAYQVEIDRQEERLKEVERVAAEALQKVVEATQEHKALEKHKEKWQKQVRREQAMKEEEAVDDIAQAQYFKKLLAELGEQ
jgi:flagellar biosynthesis chaperone FliJ